MRGGGGVAQGHRCPVAFCPLATTSGTSRSIQYSVSATTHNTGGAPPAQPPPHLHGPRGLAVQRTTVQHAARAPTRPAPPPPAHLHRVRDHLPEHVEGVAHRLQSVNGLLHGHGVQQQGLEGGKGAVRQGALVQLGWCCGRGRLRQDGRNGLLHGHGLRLQAWQRGSSGQGTSWRIHTARNNNNGNAAAMTAAAIAGHLVCDEPMPPATASGARRAGWGPRLASPPLPPPPLRPSAAGGRKAQTHPPFGA